LIALVLGGIVSLGSNVSTLRQTESAISAAEMRRSDLIGRIDLRSVGVRREGGTALPPSECCCATTGRAAAPHRPV
jgi:hypothetical protein